MCSPLVPGRLPGPRALAAVAAEVPRVHPRKVGKAYPEARPGAGNLGSARTLGDAARRDSIFV